MKNQERILQNHDKILLGKEGLVIKVDRIEQRENSRRFHIRAIWTSVATGAVMWVISIFGGKH